MSTVKLVSDAESETIPVVKAVFSDIRATRGTDFINNFWRALANDPEGLKRTNSCSYCIHSHTAAAKAQGMTNEEHAELTQIIGLAGMTNHLVTAMQVPVDPEFNVET